MGAIQDVKFSIRAFARNPGFTATAVAALTLGIGATTAVFSIVNTVLLKPLQVYQPDRFVVLGTTGVGESGIANTSTSASPAKFQHWRSLTEVLQDVSAFRMGIVNLTRDNTGGQLPSIHASSDFFESWRLRVVLGRVFTPAENLPNGARVAVLSRDSWTRRFAGDPSVLGRKFR